MNDMKVKPSKIQIYVKLCICFLLFISINSATSLKFTFLSKSYKRRNTSLFVSSSLCCHPYHCSNTLNSFPLLSSSFLPFDRGGRSEEIDPEAGKTNSLNNQSCSRWRRRENEVVTKAEKRRIALKMEEKQNVVLFPSLLRLDSLCRYLLQEEQQKQTEEENNDDKEWFSNNLWRQTLLPSAFQALAEAIVEEKGELKRKLDLNKCRESSDKLRERLQDAALKMKTHSNQTNDTLIHLSCDLVSLAVGIPLSPQRAANLPLNALKKEYTCNPNDAFNAFEAAQSILELPKDEVISFIAKQNGRFPLGLLSVARGRRVREEERSPSGPLEGNNKTDETAAYQHATEKIDYIPQVLMVSPFWIAEPCDKRKKAGAMSVQNAQKRVVESLKKLQSLNTWNENTQESKQGLKPIMESFTPFPTTFWLCNDRLGAQISEIELTGWMKKVESSQLIEDPELQLKVIHDNIRFIALRWLLIPKFLLVHFYTSNRRCAECSVHTPEGPLIPSVSANDTIEALKSGKSDTAEGEEHFNAVEELNTPRDLNKNNCNRCSVCPCRICKLMQCHRLRGMGGLLNFCRLRCLHMQYAYHLVCPTTVGNMMDLSFKVHAAVE